MSEPAEDIQGLQEQIDALNQQLQEHLDDHEEEEEEEQIEENIDNAATLVDLFTLGAASSILSGIDLLQQVGLWPHLCDICHTYQIGSHLHETCPWCLEEFLAGGLHSCPPPTLCIDCFTFYVEKLGHTCPADEEPADPEPDPNPNDDEGGPNDDEGGPNDNEGGPNTDDDDQTPNCNLCKNGCSGCQ